MFGHLALAIPSMNFFYLGLILVVIGTGLLKPNISAIVGGLYDKNTSLRDYYELVLVLDHKKQWEEYEKSATIHEDSHLE